MSNCKVIALDKYRKEYNKMLLDIHSIFAISTPRYCSKRTSCSSTYKQTEYTYKTK